MDGLVVGVAQLSFCQSLSEVTSENSFSKSTSIMSVSGSLYPTSEEAGHISDEEVNNSSNDFLASPALAEETDNVNASKDVSAEETNNDNAWQVIGYESGSIKQNKCGYTLAERRQMPTRVSKESCLLGIKRRTIMKPAKRVKSQEDFKNLTPSEIKKIYLNKKLTNFRPSSLETIFEEAPTAHSSEESRLMGGRKIKRSLSLSDGFKYSKTLVSRRRAKIKKNFGKRFALKKVSLEEFITKLNSSMEKDEGESNTDCCMDKSMMSENQNNTCQSDTAADNFNDTSNLSSFCSNDGNTMSP